MQTKILSTFLLLGAFAFALPFRAAAQEAWSIDTGGTDTVAGVETAFTVTGKSSAQFAVNVFTPGGEKIFLSRHTDARGGATVELKGRQVEMAGTYTVKVYDADGGKASETFEVFASVPAEVTLEVEDGALSPGKASSMTVLVLDMFGNILDRPMLPLSGDAEIRREGGEGENIFSIVPDAVAAVEVVVVDLLSEEEVERFTLAVEGGGRRASPGSALRAGLLEEFEKGGNGAGASDRGFVDGFIVEIIGNDGRATQVVRLNEPYGILITAVDSFGKEVRDYVGEVTVSATDTLAEVPDTPVKFYASDRGRVELPLVLMFGTPGSHDVFVEERGDPDIAGEVALRVVGEKGAVTERGIVVTSPGNGAVVGKSAITIAGAAPAFINLDLLDNGTRLAAGSSKKDGSFAFTVTLDPAVGAHEIVVREGEGGLNRASKPVILTVDASDPVMRGLVILPDTLLPGEQFTVSVTAEPGQTVEARVGAAGQVALTEEEEGADGGDFRVYGGKLTAPMEAGRYTVTVTARDASGNETRETGAITVESAGLPVVHGLRAVPVEGDITLSWNPVSPATEYRIYFGTSPADLGSHADTGSPAPSARLTGLTGGQTIFFAVTAIDAAGRESDEKSAVVSALVRGSLYRVALTSAVNGARMEWTPLPGTVAARYRVQYGVQPGLYTEERFVAPDRTQFDLRDLINGVTYHVLLSAVREDGNVFPDSVASTVVPGEGGRPGMAATVYDPLPAGVGGPEVRGAVRGVRGAGEQQHGVASPQPPAVPRSGFPPAMLPGILVLAACVYGFGRHHLHRRSGA